MRLTAARGPARRPHRRTGMDWFSRPLCGWTYFRDRLRNPEIHPSVAILKFRCSFACTRRTTSPSSSSPKASPPAPSLPGGLTARERIPQSHKIALRDLDAGRPRAALRPGDRATPIAPSPPDPGCARSCSTCPPRRRSTTCRSPPPFRPRLPAARGLHVRRLPQCRRQRGHAQRPRHRDHGAVRRAHGRLRRAPHPRGTPAAIPECGRRGPGDPLVRLRRRHRRARARPSPSAPCKHISLHANLGGASR